MGPASLAIPVVVGIRGSPVVGSLGSPVVAIRGSPVVGSRGSPVVGIQGSPVVAIQGSPVVGIRGRGSLAGLAGLGGRDPGPGSRRRVRWRSLGGI